jgi:hypothetical protein
VVLNLEETHQKKSKKIFVIGYGAIIEHFGNANPYKKNDAQQQKFTKDLSSCLWLKLTCLFLFLKVSG